MKVPTGILGRIYDHYQAYNWCIVILNKTNKVIYFNQLAAAYFDFEDNHKSIKDIIPLLATETLDEEFILPFFNHQDKTFDVHFLIEQEHKHIIMVPVDMVHQQVQLKQQMAHEEVIEKLRLKALFRALEGAHKELKDANSAKSFYISALSHEIGNPITAIKGYNQLLMEGAITTKDATTVIGKNTDKIQQIITQTLDYDQHHNTQHSIKLYPAKIIDELFADFKIQAQNKNLKLINQIDSTIRIGSNQTKLNQIFTNLISNAIKYTEQGSITIKSIVEDDLLHIDTIDTGCGMSQSFQNQLFTAWHREQKSQAQGNGIGLVISKMLAEQIGADLLLHSSDKNGSCFRFSMSYMKPDSSHHILLVDDDFDCLNLFNYYLTQAGQEVKTADSIKSINEQLKENSFDVIITDLNLTDGRVDDFYDTIRPQAKKLVVMTANPTDKLRQTLINKGFDEVLSKPLSQEQLVNSAIKPSK